MFSTLLLSALLIGAPRQEPLPEVADPELEGTWWLLAPLDAADAATGLDGYAAAGVTKKRLVVNGAGIDRAAALPARGGGEATWREVGRDPQARIEIGADLSGEAATGGAALLYMSMQADAPSKQTVWLGSDDGLRVWFNGELVHEIDIPRGVTPGEDEIDLRLQRGTNHLVCEVRQIGGAWAFQMITTRNRLERERGRLQDGINTAIDRGIDWLLRSQELDGSWGYEAAEFRNGQTALALYTLLKSGLSAEHAAVQRGLAYVRRELPRETYSASFQLMLLDALGERAKSSELEAILDGLLAEQARGFSYTSALRETDLSNTQCAALGMRAAAARDVRVPLEAWEGVAQYVLSCRSEDGGFAYRPGERPRGSMTAAGVATAKLCRDVLGASGRKYAAMVRELDEAMSGGVAWLGAHMRTDVNPEPGAEAGGGTRWKIYYLYALERLGAFLALPRLAGRDWYWPGALRLVGEQAADGSWPVGESEAQSNTCFALLFLQRASATLSGPASATHAMSWGDDNLQRAVNLRASGPDPLVLWISSFGRTTIRDHEAKADRGRGLRVVRVEYLRGDELLAEVTGDPERPAGPERWPTRLTMKEPGAHALRARVTLASGVVLESQTIVVRIPEPIAPWLEQYTAELGENLLSRSSYSIDTSSAVQGFPGERALDGRQGTSWQAAADDAAPTLVLRFKKSVSAKRLALTSAHVVPGQKGEFARARVVELRWNGRPEAVRIEIDPAADRKTEWRFDRTTALRSLELRIIERTPAAGDPAGCGFAEVELFD